MRKIKFKFLYEDLETKEIHENVFTIDELMEGYAISMEDKPRYKLIAKLQYTGIKDKNGVEIYESDLLKVRLNDEEIETVKVIFDRGSWTCPMDNGNALLVAYIMHEAEVIGNIYENPELLEDDK